MSYTKDAGDSQSWLDRLPRISSVSRSQAKTMSSMEEDLQIPPGTLPIGWPGGFLRRVKESDDAKGGSRASSLASRRRKKRRSAEDSIGPGGPISRSAIFPDPQRRSQGPGLVSPASPRFSQDGHGTPSPAPPAPALLKEKDSKEPEMDLKSPEKAVETTPDRSQSPTPQVEVYQEGDNLVVEDEMGEVLDITSSESPDNAERRPTGNQLTHSQSAPAKTSVWSMAGMKSQWDSFVNEERQKRRAKQKTERRHEPARAFQIGNKIVIEDRDGEVIKTWDVPQAQVEAPGVDLISVGLKKMGISGLVKQPQAAASGEPGGSGAAIQRMMHWPGFGDGADPNKQRRRTLAAEEEEQDDRHIRFTFQGEGRRLTKAEFIDKVQKLDPKTRDRVIGSSDASAGVREQLARVMNPKRTQSTTAPAPVSAPSSAQADLGSDSDATKTGTESSEHSPGPSSNQLRTQATGRGRSGSSTSAIIVDRAPRQQDSSAAGTITAKSRAQLPKGLQPPVVEDDTFETPAERRRREAALGIIRTHEDDSDDDDTERVIPETQATAQPRQSIRFAEPQRR